MLYFNQIKKVGIVNKMNFEDRIKLIITTYNIKQKEFAKGLKVTPQHISGILNQTEKASPVLIELICEKFNIRNEWLTYGKGEMFKENNIDKFGIIISLIKQLDKKHQDFILRVLKDLVETENENK